MRKNNISLETDIAGNGLIIALGICVLIIFGSILMLYMSSPPQKIYAARINGTPITNDEFKGGVERMKNQYIQIMKTDFNSPQGKQMLEGIEKQTLNSLIEREILLQYADKNGIEVDSATVETEINTIKEKNFNNDDKTFREALQKNNLSLSKLKEGIRKDKLVEKAREKVIDERLKITDKEKRDYYEANKATEFTKGDQVKASHILVKDEKLAEDISKQLAGGAKFDELSKKHSIDPGSKSNGGDLGFFEKGKMVPEFEKTAWSLKVGETSKPVKSQFGFHIIRKTDYKPAGVTSYEQAAKQITDNIKQKKTAEVIDQFIKEEKEKSKVEIFIARLAATPVPSVSPSAQVQTSATPAASSSPAAVKKEEEKQEAGKKPGK